MMSRDLADVCLVLEGTYPYVQGGVASWTHQLISNQKDLTFHIVTVIAPSMPQVIKYDLPKNILSINPIILQEFQSGREIFFGKKSFFERLEKNLQAFLKNAESHHFSALVEDFQKYKKKLGKKLLLNSQYSWEMLTKLYKENIPKEPFLDFFWTFRSLLGGLYSILLADTPPAKIYHTICTGYAGLFACKAHIEMRRPCLLTEHGIYTNERRIEIASANWLQERPVDTLSIDKCCIGLKNFWSNTFSTYSQACYNFSSLIITLFEGNRQLQIREGAKAESVYLIPNGIDSKRLSKIPRNKAPRPFTVAFIGRVVPIKDIKSFIIACSLVMKKSLEEKNHQSFRFWILGPADEDPSYFEECLEMLEEYQLKEWLTFFGKVHVEEFFPEVDLLVLTSISEAQPLVILEAAAAGIPTVSTDVGACEEMLYGKDDEEPKIGPSGIITPLLSPKDTALGILKMQRDKDFYLSCCRNGQERVMRYYDTSQVTKAYGDLYHKYISEK